MSKDRLGFALLGCTQPWITHSDYAFTNQWSIADSFADFKPPAPFPNIFISSHRADSDINTLSNTMNENMHYIIPSQEIMEPH